MSPKKISIIFLFFVSLFFVGGSVVYAHNYVLPYPSYMPGNKLYKLSRILDKVQGFWSWGTIAQERYHLELADKYLVEAKTLFDYQQYLLAVDALQRSNQQYQLVRPSVLNAQKQGIDTKDIQYTFTASEEKHEEVLDTIKQEVPPVFIWTPEKDKPTNLPLDQLIDEAVEIRKKEIIGM